MHQTAGRNRRLLIVQPWFSEIGHPAQSLLNTMRTLREVPGIDYLVSEDPRFPHHANLGDAPGPDQRLFRFRAAGRDLKRNTRLALRCLLLHRFGWRGVDSVLFFDMDLRVIAKLWPWYAPWLGFKHVSLLYLQGPEQMANRIKTRTRVERLLTRGDVKLCVRTEELEADWARLFPKVPREHLCTLPSLEMPPGLRFPARRCESRADLRFGILGQLRRGKSIERLVPLFDANPGIGRLVVAGSFASQAEREALQLLQGRPGFEERYLEDEELLQLTAHQDYVLVLYDQWDRRMESAVLYLSMRADRPVVIHAEGWCERMVKQFGCGVPVALDSDLAGALAALPLPGSAGYDALLEGVRSFREAHRGERLRAQFIQRVRPAVESAR